MSVTTNDVVRVTVHGNFNSLIAIQNVWYLRNDGGLLADEEALEDFVEILEALYTLLAAILSTLLVIERIRAINLTQDTDVGQDLFVDDTPGTDSGTSGAPQVCYGINFATERLGSFGRKFFGPALEANLGTTGVLDAEALGDLADVGDFATSVQVATHSTWSIGILSTVTLGFLPFTSYSITPTGTTQRRRRLNVGI